MAAAAAPTAATTATAAEAEAEAAAPTSTAATPVPVVTTVKQEPDVSASDVVVPAESVAPAAPGTGNGCGTATATAQPMAPGSVVQPSCLSSSTPGLSTSAQGALPVRAYMDATVVPVLRAGLRALNATRPDDPLQYLADFLVANKPHCSA